MISARGHGNKRRVIVPINDELADELEAAKRLGVEYVIEHNGKPIGTIKNSFEAACVRAAVKDVTPHILRHTSATWLVESGLSDDEVGRLLGDTAEMIRRVYGHHSPGYLKRATGALQFSQAAE